MRFLSRRDRAFITAIQMVTENQTAIIKEVKEMVTGMAAAAQKQSEVLQAYLQLFSGANSPPPQARPKGEDQEDRQALQDLGFPVDKTPEEQLQWILHREMSDGD